MNVNNNNHRFRIEIDETSCFYFCSHVYEVFKEKVKVRGACVLRQESKKEVIGYCSDWRRNNSCNTLPKKSSYNTL